MSILQSNYSFTLLFVTLLELIFAKTNLRDKIFKIFLIFARINFTEKIFFEYFATIKFSKFCQKDYCLLFTIIFKNFLARLTGGLISTIQ